MSGSYTNSGSSSFSDAEAKHVLGKLRQDFLNMYNRGFSGVTSIKVNKWWETISFVVYERAFTKLQIILKWDGKSEAIEYKQVVDGTIYHDNDASQIDFYKYPAYTIISLVLSRDMTNDRVTKQLEKDGWVAGGQFLTGSQEELGGYSKGNFGFQNSIIRQ